MSKVGNIWRALMRRPKSFGPHAHVVAETYVREGRTVRPVDPQDVISGAGVLEGALAMTDELEPDVPVALTMTRKELAAFVCYMRQLDTAYREQGAFIEKRIKLINVKGADFELKGVEEVAEVSPERYSQLTGKAAR